MISSYIKIALRHVQRKRVFSFINIFGLAIGFACTMLIGAFIYDELNYDRYPELHANIYRVGLQIAQNDGLDDYPNVDVAVGAGIKNAFPEVLASTRLSGNFVDYVRYQDVQFKETGVMLADSNFLSIFSIPLLEGNRDKALTEPNSIVISKDMALKYFGQKPALGEMLSFTRRGVFKVTGIMDRLPDNSHIHTDAFISMSTSRHAMEAQTWSNIGYYTYLLLNEHADAKQLEAKFAPLIEKYVVPEVARDMNKSLAEAQQVASVWKFSLMPLTDIHLHSNTKYELEGNGDIHYVYIFGALALFILLLACINFTNLSTAGSLKRSREVGVRKAMGSVKQQLMYQFLLESVVLALCAVVLALAFVLTLLPFFNELTGKHITMTFFLQPGTLGLLVLTATTVGVLAGIYPAFFLSAFNTIKVLKGDAGVTNRRGGLSNALVVLQFAISTTLIIATVVVFQQVHFMQTKKLGYNKDQVLVIENAGVLGQNTEALKNTLLQDHRVAGVTISNDAPVGKNSMQYGGTEIYGKDSEAGTIHTLIFSVDHDYLETLQMKLLIGRNFTKGFAGDSSSVVINETAMNDLGWHADNVLGRTIIGSGQRAFNVIGVIADFHVGSARQKISPLMMVRGNRGAMIVRVETDAITPFLEDLKKQWTAYQADVPLDYFFLDEKFEHLYKSEKTTEKIFIVFVIIAITIASLGLYGLSIYAVEQRVKEVGIRKVLGSSTGQIAVLLSRKFLLLVVFGIGLSVPVAAWAMHQWLQNFSYHVELSVWVFLASGALAIAIAVGTMSFQTIKAALVNPVSSLRSE
jgi:putative ABC transport system permease protein